MNLIEREAPTCPRCGVPGGHTYKCIQANRSNPALYSSDNVEYTTYGQMTFEPYPVPAGANLSKKIEPPLIYKDDE